MKKLLVVLTLKFQVQVHILHQLKIYFQISLFHLDKKGDKAWIRKDQKNNQDLMPITKIKKV